MWLPLHIYHSFFLEHHHALHSTLPKWFALVAGSQPLTQVQRDRPVEPIEKKGMRRESVCERTAQTCVWGQLAESRVVVLLRKDSWLPRRVSGNQHVTITLQPNGTTTLEGPAALHFGTVALQQTVLSATRTAPTQQAFNLSCNFD